MVSNVSLFIPSFAGGGAERVMVDVANALQQRGHRVDLLVADARGPAQARLHAQVTVISFDTVSVGASFWPLVKYLRRERPDAIYTTMMHANIVVSAAKAMARVNTRVVVREAVSLNMIESEMRSMMFRVWLSLAKFFYRRAYCVVCVCEALRNELKAAGVVGEKTNTQVIYNPIDDDLTDLCSLPIDDGPDWIATRPLIVGVGRLNEQKGFDVLIKAAAQVNRRQPVGVVLVGEGHLRDELTALANESGLDCVHMPGFLPNPYPYVAAANCFVLSSRFEGLPSVLIQALACGTPVVATNCPTGPAEILEHGKWGQLVEVDDSDAMATAILDSLENRLHVAQDFGALSRFDRNLVAESYERAGALATRE